MNLRDELLGASPTIPEFSVVLPSGWSEYTADAAAERQLLALATARLREQHRPDLAAQLRGLTGRAFAGLRSSGAIRVYLHTESWSDDLILPLSITTSVRTDPGGGTLDSAVVELIRDRGATSLHGDKRFVRWESDTRVEVGTSQVGQRTASYLTPIPESGRGRALQFTAVAVHPLGDETTWLPEVERMLELSDAIVSTFAWRAA